VLKLNAFKRLAKRLIKRHG